MKKLFIYTALILCTLASCGKAVKSSMKLIRSTKKTLASGKTIDNKTRTWGRKSPNNTNGDNHNYDINFYSGDNSDSEE